MATVRTGSRSALVVVDVQVGVVADAFDAPRTIGNMALVVERARAHGVPVVWVQHMDEALVRDSAPWQWVPELVPAAGELRIHKQFNSSFERTALEAELDKLGVSHIVLAGAMTNWCIRATAYAALERGYDLTLVSDAHTTSSQALPGGLRMDAEHTIAELNIAMTWLQYPGRTTRTATAADARFDRAEES